MPEQQFYIPDPSREIERLLVVEHALSDGGLIDNHLKWVEKGESPSASLSDAQYGHLPLRFSGVDEPGITKRPGREPIDFQKVATDVLGVDYDTPYDVLAGRIIEVDQGWYKFLIDSGTLDEKQSKAMQAAAERAFRLDTLTEDNLSAYVSGIFGKLQVVAETLGVSLPAIEEWTRGIWPAEEFAHLLSMNEYGKVTGITRSREHHAGQTSQLRAGIEVVVSHITALLTYTPWQEESTYLAHRRNGSLLGPVGSELLQSNVAPDESRHHHVYMSLLIVLKRYFPDEVIRSVRQAFTKPSMPASKGAPLYNIQAAKIASSGVFGTEQGYAAARLVVNRLGILDDNTEIQGLSGEGEAALTELRIAFGPKTAQELNPRGRFVLDHTITLQALNAKRKDYANEIGLPKLNKHPLAN